MRLKSNLNCNCNYKSKKKFQIKRYCCILHFFFLLPNILFSQDNCTNTISGKVLDKNTNKPISDVIIRAISDPQVNGIRVSYNYSDKFSISDENGKFLIEDLCNNEDSLLFSRIGYKDTLVSLNANYWTVSLTEKSVELNSVLIIDEREKNRGTQTISQQSINIDEKGVDRTLSIANIASQIDGVTFISTGSNVERPVIHGLYGNRILVLNNYLKHGFQNWGDDHAPEINVSSVDRISVIKGSSGVRFGPEALGGAIIVEPDPMKLRQPFYIKINSIIASG